MPKMGLMLMKLLEFCQEVIILKCENYLTHPFVPLCIAMYAHLLSKGSIKIKSTCREKNV